MGPLEGGGPAYIDGMTVGRGWRQMYGDALWDNKFEVRMPIVKEALWLVGFFAASFVVPEPDPVLLDGKQDAVHRDKAARPVPSPVDTSDDFY